MKEEERKVHRCRYADFTFVDADGNRTEPTPSCIREGGLGNPKRIDADECEKCGHFKSRYIEYPIVVDGIETEDLFDKPSHSRRSGCLVRVRPCAEKYEGRTLLGLMLGDLPMHVTVNYSEESRKLTCGALHNPAILVLETHEIVWGCESWWSEIWDSTEIRDITDAQIANQPYMRWLASLDGGDGTRHE